LLSFLTDDFNFILNKYNYLFSFESEKNLLKLGYTEVQKNLYNQTNPIFYFKILFQYENGNQTLFYLKEKVDISSSRLYDNKTFNYSFKCSGENFNDREIIENKDTKYDNIYITIQPKMTIELIMIKHVELDKKVDFFFNFFILDNIINTNNPKFFNNYSYKKQFKIENETFYIDQFYDINYGVVKMIDDFGIIFLEENIIFGVKKNYESTTSNKIFFGMEVEKLIMKIEINPVMKRYDRIYKKLQNIMADLGGLFNTLTLIGNILVVQLNKKKFDYDLINKLFYQETQDSKKIHIPNKNMIFTNNKINDYLFYNFNPESLNMNISNNLYKNNIDPIDAESNLGIKSFNNKLNNKQSRDSLIMSKNNPTNIDKNDLIKEENYQT